MKLLAVFLVLWVPVAVLANAKTTADKALLKKIKNLISPFPTLKMVSGISDLACQLGYNGTTVSQAFQTNPDVFVNLALSVVSNQQKAQFVQMANNINKDLNNKAQDLGMDLANQFKPLLTKIADPLSATMAKAVKKGTAKNKACANGIKAATKLFTAKLIKDVIATIKKRYTADQCKVMFKYLAPTYLSLGKYSFMNPPCSGPGI